MTLLMVAGSRSASPTAEPASVRRHHHADGNRSSLGVGVLEVLEDGPGLFPGVAGGVVVGEDEVGVAEDALQFE